MGATRILEAQPAGIKILRYDHNYHDGNDATSLPVPGSDGSGVPLMEKVEQVSLLLLLGKWVPWPMHNDATANLF
jgi:hypothetical protein